MAHMQRTRYVRRGNDDSEYRGARIVIDLRGRSIQPFPNVRSGEVPLV
jgi:hypothetical protein